MDYRVGEEHTGGSDGCINFDDADNTGLVSCVTESGLLDVYDDYCEDVSLADFIVIAAEAVYGITAADDTFGDTLKNNFKYGRTTVDECDWNDGLMPNPELGCQGLNDIFVDNIYDGYDDAWALTAALSGAHTLGSAKIDNSGYDGYWSDVDNQGIFNNDYYISLVVKGWGPEYAVEGNDAKNQWIRWDKGINSNHKEIMLSTDMCLAYNNISAVDECRDTYYPG